MFFQTGPIRLFTPYKRIRSNKHLSSNSKKKKLDDGTVLSTNEDSCDSSIGISMDNGDLIIKDESLLIQSGNFSQADIVQSNDSLEDAFTKLDNVRFCCFILLLTVYCIKYNITEQYVVNLLLFKIKMSSRMLKMVNYFRNAMRVAKYKWNTEKQELLAELKRAKDNSIENR